MFDIFAASYMSAARMDYFLEQDILHADPEIARRLRRRNGLPEFTTRPQHRARPVSGRIVRTALTPVKWFGAALGNLGSAIEKAASLSFRREIAPKAPCATC